MVLTRHILTVWTCIVPLECCNDQTSSLPPDCGYSTWGPSESLDDRQPRWSSGEKERKKKSLLTKHKICSLIPRPLPDFIIQSWRNNLHGKTRVLLQDIWEWSGTHESYNTQVANTCIRTSELPVMRLNVSVSGKAYLVNGAVTADMYGLSARCNGDFPFGPRKI